MSFKNKKKRASSYKNIFRVVCRGGILIGTLVVLWVSVTGFYSYLLRIPYFGIKEITVLGGKVVGPLEIIEEARVNVGENLLNVNLNDVRERLEQHPWIKKAMVRRIFPSGIEIKTEEREPAALIRFDEFYLIDEEGVVFKKMDREDNLDLPIITGVAMEELIRDVPHASAAVFKALTLLSMLDDNNFLSINDVSEIEIGPSYGLSIYTLDGAMKISIGDRDFINRLARFEKIAAIIKGSFKDIDFIDLDHEKKAVLRYLRLPEGYPILSSHREEVRKRWARRRI